MKKRPTPSPRNNHKNTNVNVFCGNKNDKETIIRKILKWIQMHFYYFVNIINKLYQLILKCIVLFLHILIFVILWIIIRRIIFSRLSILFVSYWFGNFIVDVLIIMTGTLFNFFFFFYLLNLGKNNKFWFVFCLFLFFNSLFISMGISIFV